MMDIKDLIFWAGIGSRDTPLDIQRQMTTIAKQLSGTPDSCFVLRSGGAIGADSAFERGADPHKRQIFLPPSNKYPLRVGDHMLDITPTRAYVRRFHPNWRALEQGESRGSSAYGLIARNTFQVLGPDLNTPSKFILCWTPDGATTVTTRQTGGTGQAIRIACAYNIPVINMRNVGWEDQLHQILQSPFTTGIL